MKNLQELKSELVRIDEEYKQHWEQYPNRTDRMDNWRDKGADIRERRRALIRKVDILESKLAETNN